MTGRFKKWLVIASAVVTVATALLVLFLGLRDIGRMGSAQTRGVLSLVGVLVTATVSLVGVLTTRQAAERLREEGRQAERRLRQEHEDQERRLRLDAAMRAGELLSGTSSGSAAPATTAAGLLALTRLDHADLAVALLVNLWSKEQERVSNETAVLVIDAALRSADRPNAQLVAAELLCRNAGQLNACQSLHWPSSIDGCWIPKFGPKTKLLLVDGLVTMTLATSVSENALRAIAVRLYGIWKADPDPRVKGCIGTLIKALMPELTGLGYSEFLQGNQRFMLSDLQKAAAGATANPDGFLDRLVLHRKDLLTVWASSCNGLEQGPGALATAT